MKYKLMPGDIVKWYPGESDYPSIVELIKPLGEEDGYPEGSWRVNYANYPISEDWVISEDEIYKVVFSL